MLGDKTCHSYIYFGPARGYEVAVYPDRQQPYTVNRVGRPAYFAATQAEAEAWIARQPARKPVLSPAEGDASP